MDTPSGPSFHWESLDQRLVTAKTRKLARKMQERIAEAEQSISSKVRQSGNSHGYFPRLFKFQEKLADEWANEAYVAYCEAWNEQGQVLSGPFIRAIRDRVIIPILLTRKASVIAQVNLRSMRTKTLPSSRALADWNRRMDSLVARCTDELEAKAVACEYGNLQNGKRKQIENADENVNDHFSISDDYCSVRYKDVLHSLTTNQSAMMRVLHNAHLRGHSVGKAKLLAAIESETSDVKDSWKKSKLWGTLIVSRKKGVYALSLPVQTNKK